MTNTQKKSIESTISILERLREDMTGEERQSFINYAVCLLEGAKR